MQSPLEFDLVPGKKVLVSRRCVEIVGSWNPRGVWEGHWMQRIAEYLRERPEDWTKGPLLLDVGANTASFCMIPALFNGLRSYAYEPNPVVADMARENIALNNLQDKVSLWPFAVGAENKDEVVLHVPIGPETGLATLGDNVLRFDAKNAGTCVVTRMVTLDEHVGLDTPVAFIKIDTEGYELFVLRGAEQIIAKWKPGLLLEYNPVNAQQCGVDLRDLDELLQAWGYAVTCYDKENLFCEPVRVL